MDFWKEVENLNNSICADLNQFKAIELIKELEIYQDLIQSAKYSMNIGRTFRAWAFLGLAKIYWHKLSTNNHKFK